MNSLSSISDLTAVSLNFSKHIALNEASNCNFVSSPLSILILLSSIAAGSSGDTLRQSLLFLKCETLDHLKTFYSEIVPVIFSDGSQIGGPKLAFAGGVWLEQSLSLKPSFKQVLEFDFKYAVKKVDFINKAPEVILDVNSWAESKTGGLVKDLLPPNAADEDSRLILANAVYFKGVWDEKFDPFQTKHHDFHLPRDNPIQVPFIASQKDQFIETFDGFKVLRLPYQQGHDKRRFSMLIFLPHAQAEFPTLMDRLCSEPNFLDRHFPYTQVKVGEFRVPKFKFSFGFETSSLLKRLGLTLPFEMGGLMEIVTDEHEGEKLFISKIYHKAAIEMNEEGTEVAAASAKMMVGSSLYRDRPKPVDFVADHPFLFLILEEVSGVIIFSGHINNPLEG